MWVIALIVVVAAVAIYYLFFWPRSQVMGKFPYRGRVQEGSSPLAALTFDDGPNEPYTTQIAALLEQHNVRGTFFQVGKSVERFPAVSQRLAAGGHTIANHSYSHRFGRYLTELGFGPELDRAEAILTRALGGRRPTLFRPPWLFRHPWLLRSAKRRGLTSVSGVFGDIFEVFQPSGAKMARRALRKVRPGMILIFHDGYNGGTARRAATVEAVKILVPQLKSRGYRLVTVDKLLGVPAYSTDYGSSSSERTRDRV